MNTRSLLRLRLLLAVVVLLLGVLMLAGGLLGAEPIKLGGSHTKYYQLVLTPPEYWWAWGVLAVAASVALAGPWLKRQRSGK